MLSEGTQAKKEYGSYYYIYIRFHKMQTNYGDTKQMGGFLGMRREVGEGSKGEMTEKHKEALRTVVISFTLTG